MTRHIDTYWAVIGAAPFTWSWWQPMDERLPEDDPFGDYPRKWINWSVSAAELGDDGSIVSTHTFTHADIVRACQAILGGIPGHDFRAEVQANCTELLYGDPDDVDFDADGADAVLQVAAFGEVRYG